MPEKYFFVVKSEIYNPPQSGPVAIIEACIFTEYAFIKNVITLSVQVIMMAIVIQDE
jgi:hypothetical protein